MMFEFINMTTQNFEQLRLTDFYTSTFSHDFESIVAI